jgi:hypothetical protein
VLKEFILPIDTDDKIAPNYIAGNICIWEMIHKVVCVKAENLGDETGMIFTIFYLWFMSFNMILFCFFFKTVGN